MLVLHLRNSFSAYAWGVLLYECLYYVNAINGGTLRSTAMQANTRQALVMMMRECRVVSRAGHIECTCGRFVKLCYCTCLVIYNEVGSPPCTN